MWKSGKLSKLDQSHDISNYYVLMFSNGSVGGVDREMVMLSFLLDME